ncbi:MAG: lactoylglutathione lyase [Clostridiaceae bacterium]|jgi:lactoylglutathione lyase|nr:lactoylglutathione lyase [Clostridiaceae bacterium]
MNFKIDHYNINIMDLEKSLAFYKNALGLKEVRRKNAEDGSFILAFLGDSSTSQRIELTWLRDKEGKYELGDNESHIAFITDDYEAAYKLHKEMGCICYENKGMGIYFIEDPDGYWIEIIPAKR